MIENPRRMVMRHGVARQVVVQKMAEGHERKMISGEAEGKVVPNGMAVEG